MNESSGFYLTVKKFIEIRSPVNVIVILSFSMSVAIGDVYSNGSVKGGSTWILRVVGRPTISGGKFSRYLAGGT